MVKQTYLTPRKTSYKKLHKPMQACNGNYKRFKKGIKPYTKG